MIYLRLRPNLKLFQKIQFASITTNNISQPKQVFISKLNDPFWNLAIEEWLFRKNNQWSHIAYFYANRPSVVMGRNQNPFKECNLELMNRDKIPLIRRQSGGGAVYHDLGNSNYCIMVPRTEFKRETHSQLVSDTLNALGCPTYLTERNDIAVNGCKISGSAYKIAGTKAYHHGTMLIGSDLERLLKYLTTNRLNLTTKGVESVRSQVINLNHFNPDLNHQLFYESVSAAFNLKYMPDLPSQINFVDLKFCESNENIVEYYNKLKGWDWIYGQTPEFQKLLQLKSTKLNFELLLELTCKHSIIVEFKCINQDSLNSDQLKLMTSWLDCINLRFQNIKYDPFVLKSQLKERVLEDPVFEKPDAFPANQLDWIDVVGQIANQL